VLSNPSGSKWARASVSSVTGIICDV
jgi:hypothetical protein